MKLKNTGCHVAALNLQTHYPMKKKIAGLALELRTHIRRTFVFWRLESLNISFNNVDESSDNFGQPSMPDERMSMTLKAKRVLVYVSR